MAKTIKSKTKLTGIVDQSTYGVNLGSYIEISKESANAIRKCLRGCDLATCFEGNETSGNSKWSVNMNIDGQEVHLAVYDIKGNFLNVTGNPTRIATGFNDIPVLVKGYEEYIENGTNSAYNTFKFFNRLLFILLEWLPSSHPFIWKGEDRKRFIRGDISIKQLQFAWYSNDLGSEEDRENVMNYLRSCYSGVSIIEGKVKNLAHNLGLSAAVYDNSKSNFNLTTSYGSNREFSLQLYEKGKEPGYNGDNEKRLQSLIRFDCTFNYGFLESNKIRKVRDLEERYKIECEKNGYDIGFYKWLSNKVIARIKLDYVAKLSSKSFTSMIDACEKITQTDQKRIIQHWLNNGKKFDSVKEKCEALNVNQANYARNVKFIRQVTGIDIDVPYEYHVVMLFNRISGRMTLEEKAEWIKNRKSNRLVSYDELKDRDEESVISMGEKLGISETSSPQIIRLRKLNPIKVQKDKLWIHKQFKEAGYYG